MHVGGVGVAAGVTANRNGTRAVAKSKTAKK
jgi:hypothetical protein